MLPPPPPPTLFPYTTLFRSLALVEIGDLPEDRRGHGADLLMGEVLEAGQHLPAGQLAVLLQMIECPSGFSGAESGGVGDRPHALVGSPIFALCSGQMARAALLGSRRLHLPTGADGLAAAGEVDRAAGPGDRGGQHAYRDGLGAADTSSGADPHGRREGVQPYRAGGTFLLGSGLCPAHPVQQGAQLTGGRGAHRTNHRFHHGRRSRPSPVGSGSENSTIPVIVSSTSVVTSRIEGAALGMRRATMSS